MNSTKMSCSTLSKIIEDGKDFSIEFTDGSIRKYDGVPQDIINTLKEINGISSVGSFYRENIKNKYSYVEVKKPQIDIKINN